MRRVKFKLLDQTLIVVLAVIFSCTERQSNIEVITCNLDETTSIHDCGIIKNVEIIQLQDTNVYITQIDKVEWMDSMFYILDKGQNSIHIFTEKGTCVNSISRRGHGANEYMELNDFFVDEESHTINALSRLDKKLFIYDRMGERLLTTKTLPKSLFAIVKYSGGYVGYSANYIENKDQPYNFWVMDKDFTIVNHTVGIDRYLDSHMSLSLEPFSKCKDAVYMITEFSNEVSVIYGSGINAQPVYVYDFGEYNCPELSDEDFQNDMRLFSIKNTCITNPLQIQVTDKLVLALVIHKGQERIIAYDKTAHKAKTLSLDAYTGKYFFSFGRVVNMDETGIYSVIEANRIYDNWIGHNEYNNFEKEYPTQIWNLRERIKSVDPDGNPFLIIYKFDK